MQYSVTLGSLGAHPELGAVLHPTGGEDSIDEFRCNRSSTTQAGIAIAWLPRVSGLDNPDEVGQSEQAVRTPSVNQVHSIQ
jgi:hypothetical protein